MYLIYVPLSTEKAASVLKTVKFTAVQTMDEVLKLAGGDGSGRVQR